MSEHVFTDDEIRQIIDVINRTKHTQYIGARYVPIFGRVNEDGIEWDNSAPYEPLTIVLHQGNSYTSRQHVPAGVEITNEQYWANTGNYNAQVEQYRQEVRNLGARVSKNEADISENTDDINTVNENLRNLGARVSQNETDISENTANIDNATNNLGALGITDETSARNVRKEIDDVKELAQTNKNNIAANDNDISAIHDILGALGAASVPNATTLANDISNSKRKLGHIYDIRDYGADTSLDDNAPKIQEAIDAAYNAGGGTVFVPAGVWNVRRNTSTVWFGAKCAIKMYSNVNLIGESMETAVLRANDGNQNAAIISGTNPMENVRIAYLRLEMAHLPAAAIIAEKGIYTQNLINCMIDHVHVNGSNGTGIGVDILQSTIIDHNIVTHCGRGWLVGHHLGCSGIGIGAGTTTAIENPLTEMSIVSNNIVLDSGQFGIFYEHQGLNVETEEPASYDGHRFAEVIICNNVLRSTTWKGIGIVALQGVQVYNNVIHGAQCDGIEISKWTNNCSVRGNSLIHCKRGITVGVDAERDVAQGPKWTLEEVFVCDNDITCEEKGITLNANIVSSRISGNTVICRVPNAVAFAVTGVDADHTITATKFFADGNVSPSRTVTRDVVWVESPSSTNQFNTSN